MRNGSKILTLGSQDTKPVSSLSLNTSDMMYLYCTMNHLNNDTNQENVNYLIKCSIATKLALSSSPY